MKPYFLSLLGTSLLAFGISMHVTTVYAARTPQCDLNNTQSCGTGPSPNCYLWCVGDNSVGKCRLTDPMTTCTEASGTCEGYCYGDPMTECNYPFGCSY